MPWRSSPRGKAVLSGLGRARGPVRGLPERNIANASAEGLDCAGPFIDAKRPLEERWRMLPGFGGVPEFLLSIPQSGGSGG